MDGWRGRRKDAVERKIGEDAIETLDGWIPVFLVVYYIFLLAITVSLSPILHPQTLSPPSISPPYTFNNLPQASLSIFSYIIPYQPVVSGRLWKDMISPGRSWGKKR